MAQRTDFIEPAVKRMSNFQIKSDLRLDTIKKKHFLSMNKLKQRDIDRCLTLD